MKILETIGIDISKLCIDVRIYSNQAYRQFENSKKGFRQMLKWSYKNSPFSEEKTLIVFEHTGLYSHSLAVFLTEENIPFSMVPGLEIKRSLGIARGKDDKVDALKIAKKIISQQFSGGWGPSKDELTMWATQQSIEFLINVENQILKTISNLEYLLSCVRGISFLGIKLFITLIGAAIASIFLFFPDYRASFLVGIFLMVVPWLLKRG